MDMTYILQLQDRHAESLLGGKARPLAQLKRAGVLIPDGFALSPAAFESSLTPEQRQLLEETRLGILQPKPTEIQTWLATLQLSESVKRELRAALAELCPNSEPVAVRSSASDEDGAQHSFAGQLDSFLGVFPDAVAEKIAAVWQSAFSDRVLTYRRDRGLPPLPNPSAVLIQRALNPEAAGVAFAADPVTGKRSVTAVSAVWGLGTSLVSGEESADTYHIDREGRIIHRHIADKRRLHRLDSYQESGIATVEVPPDIAQKPALNDQQIRDIAALARQVSRHFHRPQDIEWAIENGQLYLLQSRPITALAHIPDPDGVFNLWDNSNIAESYSGVTTPLTFSFARKAYEEVYRQFCRFMGVPQPAIARHSDTFSRMIGLIQGRIYYNLLSWYRTLALLPGFTVNRHFMEQMMGVRESLPESAVAELQSATWQDRLQDSWRLLATAAGLVTNYFQIPRRTRQFYQRLDAALNPPQFNLELNLEDLRPDELAAHYRNIERQLLTRWDAPLINDFFTMIFYGVLRRLTEKWCGDGEQTLQNDLISGEGGIISAEPAQRMRDMANSIAQNPDFVSTLCGGSLNEIVRSMEGEPQFQSQYREYLHKFGDRCLEELKLESPTLYDDPLPLLRAVGQLALACRAPNPISETGQSLPPISLRKAAEQRVKRALKNRPLRRLVFNWVLKNARERVRDRENLRFERTRVFGRARRVFVEIGRRFYALDVLGEPRDIFYLEVGEILGFIEGTATTTDLKGLAAVRQAEFARYRQMPPPADRFETFGVVCQGNSFQKTTQQQSAVSNSSFQGIGCSPGVVRGCVRAISDPKQIVGAGGAPLKPGTILVAQRTDPGWILLFPAAAGLLVERGSLLSHAAIVARELGLPAIVSLPGVTQWLKDGDWVEMDGSTGRVCKIPSQEYK